MIILFLTLFDIRNIDDHDIYSDLIREFAKKDNEVYIISPIERKFKTHTYLIEFNNSLDWHRRVHIVKKKTLNIQKTNILEKGIATFLIESQIKSAIKKYFKNIRFDLVIYTTPPITLVNPIKYVKKRDKAVSYLLLKDIFPQNAVDLGMLSKGLIYNFFRAKEIQLYSISDRIGCMSQANVEYLLANNPYIKANKVEICPNCIEPFTSFLSIEEKKKLLNSFSIPNDKKLFVYGGNLGKPQGISFLIDCLKAESGNESVFFLIIGDGTEYDRLDLFIKTCKPNNVKLMKFLPKKDYDKLVSACDFGMIFLDYRFTIPNFPSRLLSYVQSGLQVLAVTDPNTDIGRYVESRGIGLWCPSNDVNRFIRCVELLSLNSKKYNGLEILEADFNLKKEADKILEFAHENSCK